jgi:hypothetical protein
MGRNGRSRKKAFKFYLYLENDIRGLELALAGEVFGPEEPANRLVHERL